MVSNENKYTIYVYNLELYLTQTYLVFCLLLQLKWCIMVKKFLRKLNLTTWLVYNTFRSNYSITPKQQEINSRKQF